MVKTMMLSLALFSMSITGTKATTFNNTEESKVRVTTKTDENTEFFPVLLYSEDEQGNLVTKEIYITATLPNTDINTVTQEGIVGNDFKTTFGRINQMTNKELIEIAKVVAWNLNTRESVPIVDVRITQVSDYDFKVCYATEKGTTTCVNAVELESELLPSDLLTITTNPLLQNRFIFRTRVISYILLLVSFVPLVFGFYIIKELKRRLDETYYYIYKKKD